MVALVGGLTVLQFLLDTDTYNIKVHLAKNQLPQDLSGVQLTDLVEADFSGYAAIENPEFTPPAVNTLQYAEAVSVPLVWTVGPLPVAQDITAVYITEATIGGMDKLLFVQPVAQGVTLSREGQQFLRQLRIMVASVPL